MSKRFIDTSIWDRPWFSDLEAPEKAAIMYLFSKCDSVGVWVPNFKLANFQLGATINWDELSNKCNKNIRVLDNGYWWIVDFVKFQYGELREDSLNNKPHQSYISLLKKHGLWETYIEECFEDIPRRTHSITDTARTRIFSKYGKICIYCGKELSDTDVGIDHIIPVSGGGSCFEENLVPCCSSCNSKKSDMDVIEFMDKYSIVDKNRQIILSILPLAKATTRTIHSHKEKDKEKNKEKEIKSDDSFDAFWASYPRKINRRGAERAWAARVKEKSLVPSEVMTALENYVKSCAGKDIEYVMHPSTFLGPAMRWKDYLVTSPKRIPSSVASDGKWTCTMCRKQYGKDDPMRIGGVCVACEKELKNEK